MSDSKTTMRWRALAVWTFACLLPPAAAQQAPAPFTDGTRWCALGDSITHSGTYHDWIALFHVTRFPTADIRAFNCGISGDTAAGGLQRLSWDVLPRNPTVTSVMFGMNDVGRHLYSADPPTPELAAARRSRIDAYRANLRALVLALQSAGSQVILLTPTIYDESPALAEPSRTGVDAALAECAEYVRQLAAETGSGLVDFHAAMTMINRELQARDPAQTVVGPDRIHPGATGHLLLAYEFLRAQGLDGEVARLVIDLGRNQFAATNGTVENVVRTPSELRFSWTAAALPFPLRPDVLPVLSLVPFTDAFNREILQVAGLPAGNWNLEIDGELILTTSADELAEGINLALHPSTPQYRQAVAVMRLLDARSQLVVEYQRSLAQVEHQSAPDLPRPVTLEAMQPYLEKRLASFAEAPPAPSTRRNVELYPERKAREAETLIAVNRLWDQARRAAQPHPHLYALRRPR